MAALLCASVLMIHAQDANATPPAKTGKKQLTPEQQTVMNEMLAKYDTNKDGKLDKTERAAMSQEDKDKMAKAGLLKGKKSAAPATDTTTNAPAAADANK